jgi:2-polyprenyl-3-methyl-5-hydroxy-6-metoxy-1,4-benzoquinol methylase
MKNLTENFNNHQFPKFIFEYSILLKLVHFTENLTRLKNWHIHKALKQFYKESEKIIDCIDVGCGSGVFTLPYAPIYTESNFTCADKNINNINFVKNYFSKFNLTNVIAEEDELGKMNTSNKYDIVLCISVLEYIENDIEALKNLKEILKEDGTLLLYFAINGKRVLPFFNYLYWQFLKSANYNIHNKYCHKYTKKNIFEKLDLAGLNVINTKTTYGFLGKLQFEIFTILERFLSNSPLFFAPIFILLMIIFLPFLLMFMSIDYLVPTKNGNGFLVLAKGNKSD